MHPLMFIGGAVVGAAGLLGAALYDKRRTEAKFSPLLKNAAGLDAAQVIEQLNDYYLKSNALSIKCSGVLVENCGLHGPWLGAMPDDDFLHKAFADIDRHVTPVMRKWTVGQIADLGEEAKKLYIRYKGCFERANALIAAQGERQVDLSGIKFPAQKFSLDNSVQNDNWGFDLDELADIVRNYLDHSADIAEKLVQLLEKGDSRAIDETKEQITA